jgi:hypothetical protein
MKRVTARGFQRSVGVLRNRSQTKPLWPASIGEHASQSGGDRMVGFARDQPARSRGLGAVGTPGRKAPKRRAALGWVERGGGGLSRGAR